MFSLQGAGVASRGEVLMNLPICERPRFLRIFRFASCTESAHELARAGHCIHYLPFQFHFHSENARSIVHILWSNKPTRNHTLTPTCMRRPKRADHTIIISLRCAEKLYLRVPAEGSKSLFALLVVHLNQAHTLLGLGRRESLEHHTNG